MLIEPFRSEDIPEFLELAAAEGWLADPWEFSFLLSAFPAGCFAARDSEAGQAIGFVTALRHERSGWIGNLIVRNGFRGNGIGEALFLRAAAALRKAGVETIWLTASPFGKSLYEKHGFTRIDTIRRWTGRAGENGPSSKNEFSSGYMTFSVSGLDCQAWGDRRDRLLTAVTERGSLLVAGKGFLAIQPCGTLLQLGPFSADGYAEAEYLLDAALAELPRESVLCLDSPDLNCGALQLLAAKGFQITGSSDLMRCGMKPAYRPELIYGLASMGSMG